MSLCRISSERMRQTDPDDFAAVAAGLEKLRNRQYHREPLTKALGDGLFELRHVGKLNTRVLWFFVKGPAHHRGSRYPQQRSNHSGPRPSTLRRNGCATGMKEMNYEQKRTLTSFWKNNSKTRTSPSGSNAPGRRGTWRLQLAALREKAGLSQKQLARKLRTSQQNVSRLESPSYKGHSLSMLRRVAGILGATVRVVIEPPKNSSRTVVAEAKGRYRSARRTKRSR